MSKNTDWDIDKCREEHESDEHWELRRAFMVRWKDDYPEERLLCLARVFTNIEFMGCRYPLEIMKEVSRLSEELVKSHRLKQKGKLQRTFVSASDAAEDRARGVKRQGGIVVGGPATKNNRIDFIPQGHVHETTNNETVAVISSDDEESEKNEQNINKNEQTINRNDHTTNKNEQTINENEQSSNQNEANRNKTNDEFRPIKHNYHDEMMKINCIDIRYFKESMFHTEFGRMVLIVRPWSTIIENMQASSQTCRLQQNFEYSDGLFRIIINNNIVAEAEGGSRAEARSICDGLAWKRLLESCISILFKEKYIAQGDTAITCEDVSSTRERKNMETAFGTPIESSVATKMMKMMGWTGGGLGADSQGISEPIKPDLQMVNRSGLGSNSSDIHQIKRAATDLMKRYSSCEGLDVDLVFSSEFTKEERAALHMIAKRLGLASTSYGKDEDRFLVVKKKFDPFSLVRAVIQKGGETPKYKVFIPQRFHSRRR